MCHPWPQAAAVLDFMFIQAQVFVENVVHFWAYTCYFYLLERQRPRSPRYCCAFLPRRWLLLSQRIEGADTILFVMFFYEYDKHCPVPNQGLAYIALVDSVRHMQPGTRW